MACHAEGDKYKAKDKKLDGGIPQQTGVRKRKADG